jgi:hypothetical protein
MKLTSKLLATAGVVAFAALGAGQADASTVKSTLFFGEQNQWSDNSAERQNVDANGNGFLDQGDTLRGIFTINTVEDQTGGGGSNPIGTNGVNELTGIFEIQVASATQVSDNGTPLDPSDDLYDYVFQPYAPFATEFSAAANTMIVFFEDPTPDYDRTGTIATGEATATDGTKILELGFTGDADEGWDAFGAPYDPSVFTTIPLGGGVGSFNFDVGILYNALFQNWGQVACFGSSNCGTGDGLVDFHGQGGLLGTSGSTTAFDVFDNVDMTFRPLPEPASLGLFGLGLLGLGAVARRRRKA